MLGSVHRRLVAEIDQMRICVVQMIIWNVQMTIWNFRLSFFTQFFRSIFSVLCSMRDGVGGMRTTDDMG